MPSSSSSGFGGVEYAILQKNPRVTLRDVGNSGVLGPAPAGKTATPAKDGDRKVDVAAADGKEAGAKDAKPRRADEPVPLFIQADGPMRIDLPPDRLPVAVGPPEPPAPTLVRFERNVVALHGRTRPQPDQLDCDTLRLTLVPASSRRPSRKDKADRQGRGRQGRGRPPPRRPRDRRGRDGRRRDVGDARAGRPAIRSGHGCAGRATRPAPAGGKSRQRASSATSPSRRLHATGHAVWLQLRQQGSKVRCNELIHDRLMPYRPDSTFFRGDTTRQIWLEKIDYEPRGDATAAAAGGEAASPVRPSSRRSRPEGQLGHACGDRLARRSSTGGTAWTWPTSAPSGRAAWSPAPTSRSRSSGSPSGRMS